jgi:hypothetical protein
MTGAAAVRVGRSDSRSGPAHDLAAVIAVLACATMVAGLLYLAARPLDTSDLWWHLKLGETYAQVGPWPDGDPLLHTAHADAPVQHEWLFGVAVHSIRAAGGFHALRLAHGLAVAAILWLALALFRNRGAPDRGALTCLALCTFVTLTWWRLFQLRPDLFSIAAVLLLTHALLATDTVPGRARVAAVTVLFAIWVNVHSLFAIGLLLLVAALLGRLLAALLARAKGLREPAEARLRARRLAEALALGTLASLFNPRGIAQHLTFFTSSSESAIWLVKDEWTHFDPLRWGHYAGGSVSLAGMVAMDVLIASFAVGVGVAFTAFWRRPSLRALDRFAPERFGLALAAFVAIAISVRFFWLAVFPLGYLLALCRSAPRLAGSRATAVGIAATCVALLAAFSGASGFGRDASLTGRYLARPYSLAGYTPLSVRFLRASGVRGRLFNSYEEGGFLGFWLAPKLRTFIDSRTEHYSQQVARDYVHINEQRGDTAEGSFLELLDRYEVDFFLGSGLPIQRLEAEYADYTTAHLEGAPGWIPVFRTREAAVYLRSDARNQRNRERIAAWYAREGVPFDAERGLDVATVIAARPDWAIAHGMLPLDYARLLEERSDADPALRFRALDALGACYLALGAYEAELAVDRQATALQPRARAPRRRRVFSLLRTGRSSRARIEARSLIALDPDDIASKMFLRAARRLAEAEPGYSPEASRAVGELPAILLDEAPALFERRFTAVPPASDPAAGP